MEELYEMIEKIIKDAGVPIEIDGREFYRDVSKEVDEKENGKYMFMIKKSDDVIYEGCMDIMDSDFDLHYADIRVGDKCYHVNFDV